MRPISPAGARRLPRLVRVVIPLAAVLALTVAATACSDDDPDEADATTTTSEPTTTASTTSTTEATTTTEPPTPEEQVEAAYLEAMAVFHRVAEDPDPDDPELEATRVGENLALVRDVLTDLRNRGIHVVYANDDPPVPEILEVEVGGEKATVTLCIVDASRQLAADGSVVDDDVVTQLNRADMQHVDGAWKVAYQTGLEEWPDGEGCDR